MSYGSGKWDASEQFLQESLTKDVDSESISDFCIPSLEWRTRYMVSTKEMSMGENTLDKTGKKKSKALSSSMTFKNPEHTRNDHLFL